MITVTSFDSVFVDYVERVEKEVEGQVISTMERVYYDTDAFGVGNIVNSLRARNFNALVVIKADKDATFGTMQKIMDTMVESGLPRFQVVTELESEAI
jgi:biopolymer transport protein ExbD